MANPFGLQEVTLNELGDSTNAINTIGATAERKSAYQPLTVIVTDHDYTTASPIGWPDGGATPTATPANEEYMTAGMAMFHSKRHGEPWVLGLKDVALTHKLHQAAETPEVPTDTTVLYPNFDYTTFE